MSPLEVFVAKRQGELGDGAGTARTHGRGNRVADRPLVSSMVIAAGYISLPVRALHDLATQRGVLAMDAAAAGCAVTVFCGTLPGLVIRCALDRRWTFMDRSTRLHAHGQRVALQSVTGRFATVTFRGTATAFRLIWRNCPMREFGTVIGLSIGSTLKRAPDRGDVFTSAAPVRPGGAT